MNIEVNLIFIKFGISVLWLRRNPNHYDGILLLGYFRTNTLDLEMRIIEWYRLNENHVGWNPKPRRLVHIQPLTLGIHCMGRHVSLYSKWSLLAKERFSVKMVLMRKDSEKSFCWKNERR